MVGQVGDCRHRRAKDDPFLLQLVLVLVPMKGHPKVCVVAFLSTLNPPFRPGFRAVRPGRSVGCSRRVLLAKSLGVKVENGFRQEL